MNSVLSNIYYFFIGIIMSICLTLDIPMKAIGRPLDITGYELVWSDEFEGDALDTTKWQGHVVPLGSDPVAYDGGYLDPSAVSVNDGNLILSIKRYPESAGDRAGEYYFFYLDSRPGFSGTYGYYECRAKLAKARAGNCAFWLNSPTAYDYDVPKEEGVEIDVMESMRYGVEHEGSVENNIHYFDSTGHQRLHARWVIVDGDPYEEFHTYGLKWDESGYTFYVDGKECRQTDFGACHGAEYICLSNTMRPSDNQYIVGDSADFVVDYVRVYQKAP